MLAVGYLDLDQETCLTRLRSLRRVCSYPIPTLTQSNPEGEIARLQQRVEDLENYIGGGTTLQNTENTENTVQSSGITSRTTVGEINKQRAANISLSLFYLDQRFFSHVRGNVSPASTPVPPSMEHILKEECSYPQGLDLLTLQYFEFFHGWMPIISKIRIQRMLNRSQGKLQADAFFLLSCMKLLLRTPGPSSQAEMFDLYKIIKMFSLNLELAGLQSLMTVQGSLLIAVYEMGHGIYPAAYTTVALCARQSISLGFHNCNSPHFLQPWANWEEHIRVWWFIVMLDRYGTISISSHRG